MCSFSVSVLDVSWPPASQHRTGAKSQRTQSHSDDVSAQTSHFPQSHWTSDGDFQTLRLKVTEVLNPS